MGRRCELIFDPFDLADIEVRFERRSMGRATPVHIGRRTHPRARPEAAPAAVPSGIDYLSLLATRRDSQLAGRIDYSALAACDAGQLGGATARDNHCHDKEDD